MNLTTVPLDLLVEAERNPNQMDEAKLDALAQLIKKYGFLQPICVSPIDETGTYVIVDGHHRARAARMAGLTAIPAEVRDTFTDADIDALRVGMNLLRGQLDFSIVADIAQDLRDEWGWDYDQIGTGFGFSDEELDELFALNAVDDDGDIADDLGGGGAEKATKSSDDKQDKAPKGFELKIEYDSRAHYMQVRRALHKAGGGKDVPLADCLDALIASATGESNE